MRDVKELSVNVRAKSAGRFDYTCCFFVCACIFPTMRFCAGPFCSNRTPKDSRRGTSFHRLPISKKKIAQAWLVKLGRDEQWRILESPTPPPPFFGGGIKKEEMTKGKTQVAQAL